MKKFSLIIIAAMMSLSLVGCGDEVTLTEEQNDLIAEYVAGVMLKYSYDNEWEYTKVRTALNKYESKGTSYAQSALITASTAANTKSTTSAATKASTTTGTTTATTAANGTTTSNGTTTATTAASDKDALTSVAEALGITNATISVKGASANERYPMDEYAVCLSAKDGYKIVAVEFDIKNTSGQEITLNTASSGVSMRLNIGGKTVVQSASLLTNDIIALNNVKVAAGDTYTAVACFQVSDGVADSSDISVAAYKSGSTIGTISGITNN